MVSSARELWVGPVERWFSAILACLSGLSNAEFACEGEEAEFLRLLLTIATLAKVPLISLFWRWQTPRLVSKEFHNAVSLQIPESVYLANATGNVLTESLLPLFASARTNCSLHGRAAAPFLAWSTCCENPLCHSFGCGCFFSNRGFCSTTRWSQVSGTIRFLRACRR